MAEQPESSQPGELLKPWEQAVMEGTLYIPCRCREREPDDGMCHCDEQGEGG